MNIKEINSKKLFKEFEIQIPYKDIDDSINDKINELKENATYVSPHQYSTGMKNVIVNGKISVVDGKKIKGRNGKVIRSFSD